MLDGLQVEIGRIVMISSNEQQPVVSLRQSLTASFVEILVVAWFLESKTTIASNDNHGIGHTILYATFIDKLCEVAMDIATHYKAFGVGKVVHVLYLLITHF